MFAHVPRFTSHKAGGFFITLEGPEGSGKSSQGRWLVSRLRRVGCRVMFVRDPGSTVLGRALRRVLLHQAGALSPLTEALLFIGGRVPLVEERIRPALQAGSIVICDRFHDATMAYQGFAGGLDVEWLDRLGRRAIHGVMPTLTVVFDVPAAVGFARLKRARDRMERKALAFHHRVRRGYLTIAKREPHRVVVIDATRPLVDVRQQLAAVVLSHLHNRHVGGH